MVLRQAPLDRARGEQDKILTGLTSEEARKRLEEFGPNELPKPREFSGLKIFISQFKSPLVYILVFAGIVTLFLQDFTDSIVIFAAVFLNTILGFYQERKAQRALFALRLFLAPRAKVVRDGKRQEIDAADLVPGDLVILTIGTRVPVDGVLVEATDFSVNEAILTGESMPVEKRAVHNAFLTALVAHRNFGVGFRFSREGTSVVNKTPRRSQGEASQNLVGSPRQENQVFMGTTVTTGIAKMIVTKTGVTTEMGKIGKRVEEIEEEETPLQIQLGKLAKILAIIVGLITLFIFIFGEFLGYEPLEMFTTSVAVAVAAIPEGLVVTLTVILALGMQRILQRKAIVRKLLAAETLGSVSVICADKTGTLTEGALRVVKGDFINRELGIKSAILCNDMRDSLEVAMWEWALRQVSTPSSTRGAQGKQKKVDPKLIQEKYPRLDEIPFSPQTKMIATLHSAGRSSGQALLFLSGAPEVILSKCRMKNIESRIWKEKFENYGKKGYRLVGFGYKKVQSAKCKVQSEDLKDLEWLGILLYEDPIREGVKEALGECQRAGIKVKVITGDYLPTALAVIEKLGLDGREHSLTGDELEKLSREELDKVIGEIVLFARTNPEQKLKIVQALKDNGEVVAMMGDGVNDAPALKQADIGIVVGEASDVAKETADMVLLDSNFATIVHAIEEGRTIFENIKKVVLYLLSDSFTEIILIGGSLLLRLPLPVTAAQILWVNLIEDTFPGIALAFEPEEKEIMGEAPRPREAPILDFELKILIFIIGISADLVLLALFYWLLKGFLHLHYIQTVMFVALGIDSLFIAFACRTLRRPFFMYPPFSNRFLIVSIILGFFLLGLAVYLPFLQTLLKTHPLGIHEWLFLLGIGLFNLLVIELTKWVFIIQKKKVKI